jgi:ABC-2 type transport system ATP-binding protein
MTAPAVERLLLVGTRPLMVAPRSTLEPAARLSGVHKSFGDIEALRGVDLELHRGETLALLGPNGAGKTTALSIALGLRRPDRGDAKLFGKDPRRANSRRAIGVTPQQADFPMTLKVCEIVDLVREHYPAPLATRDVIDRFGLGDVAERQTGGLSGGERRRLAVALAFAGNPAAVFLDEPTTGLDVEARHGLWAELRDYVAGGGTILLTTHYLEEAEALASRVALIDCGRVIASGTVDQITSRVSTRRVRLRARHVPSLPSIDRRELDGDAQVLYTRDSDALVRELVSAGVSFKDLTIQHATLEDAFMQLTGSHR